VQWIIPPARTLQPLADRLKMPNIDIPDFYSDLLNIWFYGDRTLDLLDVNIVLLLMLPFLSLREPKAQSLVLKC